MDEIDAYLEAWKGSHPRMAGAQRLRMAGIEREGIRQTPNTPNAPAPNPARRGYVNSASDLDAMYSAWGQEHERRMGQAEAEARRGVSTRSPI